MSRVWLLCYVGHLTQYRAFRLLMLQVIQGTQQLVTVRNRQLAPPVGHDPDFYCEQLIPDGASRTLTSSYDVILVYRAKLVELLKGWYRKSSNLWNKGPNAEYDLKKMANATNARLDEWKEDFDSFATVSRDQSRQLTLFYDFARVLVNAHSVEKLEPGQQATEPFRQSSLSKAIVASLDFCERCLEWTPREFAAMPSYDLNVSLTTRKPGVAADISVDQCCDRLHARDWLSCGGRAHWRWTETTGSPAL